LEQLGDAFLFDQVDLHGGQQGKSILGDFGTTVQEINLK
jgi:hypothetical protein